MTDYVAAAHSARARVQALLFATRCHQAARNARACVGVVLAG